VDHVTNWEWSCFAPYAVPIVLVTWNTGRRLGFVFAFLCAATYWAADSGSNPYQTRWGFALAVAGWWFYFSVLVVAVTALKARRELDRMRIEALERTQALERQILRTSEREQQRIGRDLHDSLGPHLAAIRYAATFLANDLRQRGQPEAAKAEQICKLTGDAGSLARDLARGIFPVQMDGAGLAIALKDLAGTTSHLTGIPVSFYEMGDILVEDPEDGMHLYRIAQEAVNNAAKHGGPRKITIVLSQIQDSLRLTVADDGKGLGPSPDGTRGMGLDSMRYRARVLGGELNRFPPWRRNDRVLRNARPFTPAGASRIMTQFPTVEKKKVLIVEDHPLFRAMLVQLIRQELGMTVCGEADNIKNALTLIEQTHPDAAIVDLTLPGSGGLELIKQLKARNLGLPVLVLSMHTEKLYAERVLRAGAKGYVSKQESPAEVVEAIRKVLDGRIYVSERVNEAILERLGRADKAVQPSGVDLLSDREVEVFQLIGRGLNSREIAGQLNLGPTTVDSYRARIKEKLGIKNAAELYQRAAQWLAESGL